MNIKSINQQLNNFHELVENKDLVKQIKQPKGLKTGVDLGTSSIVLVVLDESNRPLFGAYEYAKVVRDGIIVDYLNSVRIVRKLKEEAEAKLGVSLTTASGAIPPGTGENSEKVVANVLGDAGFDASIIIDEPTAAARFLNMTEGSVIDIGGGTTGISNFEKGQSVAIFDEPTGGYHMSLVVSGAFSIPIDEAELLKRNRAKEVEVFGAVRPVVEKMATIAARYVVASEQAPVVVVGGATNFKEFVHTFEKIMKRPVIRPQYPEFVTPIGIAMFDQE